jgi:hypothetical protein
MRLALLVVVVCIVIACATTESRAQDVQQQLEERDKEIAELRRQLHEAQQAQPSSDSLQKHAARDVEDEESSRALERALVLQGGYVIPTKAAEIEPEITYFYSEPNGVRRDIVRPTLTLRYGLPWAAELDVRVPYVAYDHLGRMSPVSGLGDIDVALTKELIAERASVPALLVSARWKSTSGRTGSTPPTGTGVDTVQASLTAVKRQDPIVFFGSVSYIASLGSGPFDIGDLAGIKLGVFLAATPDTSVFVDIDVTSSFSNENDPSGRLFGIADVGFLTILSRTTALNINAGFGFTPAAPDFRLTISLPIRF